MTPPDSSTKSTPTTKSPEIKAPPADALKVSFDTPADLGIDNDTPAVTEVTKPAENKQPDSSTSAVSGQASADKAVESDKTKVEGKEVAEDTESTEQKPATTPVTKDVVKPIKPSEAARDYTGFNAEEVKVLKQMSNASFAEATKWLKEKKQLEAVKEYQYLQHPEAYVLHPDYKRTQEDSYYANAEAQYWQQQLINIREGRKWQPIQGWDKNGQPVLGAEQEPTTIAEEQVRSVMNAAAQAGQQATGKLQMFQQQYTNAVQQYEQQIKAEQQRRFGWHQDPKMLDNVINIEGLGDKSIKSIKQDFTNLFPSHYRSSVLTDIAGDLFVALQIYAAEIRALKSQTKVAEIKKEEILRGEPSSAVKPSSEKGKTKFGGVSEFSLEGLPTM